MTAQEETWLPVLGYEGLYKVSDYGTIRSLDRICPDGRGYMRRYRGRVLATSFNAQTGRHQVRLHRDGFSERRYVYVAVLEAFVSPRPAETVACHTDGDPANNVLSNLRWDTSTENMRDAVRHGSHPQARKTHCIRGHKLCEPNLRVRPPAKAGNQPRRNCLACHRGRVNATAARKRGTVLDFHEAATHAYTKIMKEN